MASCVTNIAEFLAENGTLDVSDKYKQLMADSLGDGSLYERVKDTYQELFKDLNVSESEKLNLVASNIANMANTISAQAMTTAISWAQQERDAAYNLAYVKAQTELLLAQKELTAEQVCKAQNETELTAAQLAEVLAGTIRQDSLAAAQTSKTEADKYALLADAFRKSGKVNIGADIDGVEKGLTGDVDGYTETQDKFLARQILSFEDSKRNHAANAASQLIGQMLSAEIDLDPNDTKFNTWQTAMDYLITNTPQV